MLIDQEPAHPTSDRDSVLAVGVFDGVHRGHRHLIRCLMSEASDTDRLAGVVTFRNHPGSVLDRDFKPRYLTGLEERVHLIEGMGVDFVAPLTFDIDLSRLRAAEFVSRLQERFRMRGLVVGPDFAMGRRREGDGRTLSALGRDAGFTVTVVDLLADGGEPVSSTSIRDALALGDVARAAALLGRSFALTGVVVKGVGRGRSLGFPTINLGVPPGRAVPGDGVYATWVYIGGSRHMAATSVGPRPTFHDGERTVEAFVLDFDGDLYDQEVRMEFAARLRGQTKYESPQALREQIGRDVEETRRLLYQAEARGPGAPTVGRVERR